MTSSYTSHVGLVLNKQGAFFVSASDPSQWRMLEPHVPSVLEIFTHHHSLADAYSVYETTRQSRTASLSTLSHLLAEMVSGQAALLLVKQKVLVCAPDSLAQAYGRLADTHAAPEIGVTTPGIRDLTTMSKTMPLVAAALLTKLRPGAEEYPALTLEEFRLLAERLTAESLLTVPIGGIDFGDFKRPVPFCPQFGGFRGSPVDRYYLDKFVAEIRSEVKGVTLEIGGSKANREVYDFTNATSYLAMDLQGEGLDIIGDAHDPKAVDEASLDSVVLFNVLEHCERPWLVVDNIYQWLKPRGEVFCMVPNAQRVHRLPQDYWRIFPDAMNSLFARFPQRKLYVYGNPLTTLAAYYGIAAEELSREDLDYRHESYPVANCIHAQKAVRDG
jgi:SAM-dependent methyltransferase